MFCGLSQEVLHDLDTIGMQLPVPRGSILFREADSSRSVHIICSGQVKLSCSSKEGKILIVKIAMPGDVLGLSAAISGLPYEVTAEALEATLIKSIRREDFIGFLHRQGEASMQAARSMSKEYKAAFVDARRLALAPTAAGKVASVLLGWGRTACCGKQTMQFTMALTHEELAHLAGTTRETVTRTLGAFQKDGLIRIKGSSMCILAPERLSLLET